MRSRIQNLPLPRLLRSWKPHIAELSLLIGSYLVYLLTRGVVFPEVDQTALQNAHRVISLERSLEVFWEPGWQAWALFKAQALVTAFNWTYIITYWPIVLGVGLGLYVKSRSWYYYYRTVVVVSLVIALVVFTVFPVAPPFQVTAYFVDTIHVYGPSYYGSPEMAVYYNTNAAMPSLHFCWTVIFGVLFLRTLRGWLKIFGALYPALTFFAITITGNHFILDAVAGGLLAVLAFGIMELGIRRRFNMSG